MALSGRKRVRKIHKQIILYTLRQKFLFLFFEFEKFAPEF